MGAFGKRTLDQQPKYPGDLPGAGWSSVNLLIMGAHLSLSHHEVQEGILHISAAVLSRAAICPSSGCLQDYNKFVAVPKTQLSMGSSQIALPFCHFDFIPSLWASECTFFAVVTIWTAAS